MDPTLHDLHTTLTAAQKLSLQGSYQRRAPSQAALPHLLKARSALIAYTKSHPDNPDAWRLRSLAEETLLQYGAATRSLQRALDLSPTKDRKDLKRLAALKESGTKWQQLLLSPHQLAQLGTFLDAQLRQTPCTHSLDLTQRWLTEHHPKNTKSTLQALQSFGGYCDCEVLTNVVTG